MSKHSSGWACGMACWLTVWVPANTFGTERMPDDALPNGSSVVRDSDGIPHISAMSERDAMFVQGYVHAQDRLFQMDVSRRQADGTLAELLGSAALTSDVQLRTFGLRRASERALPNLSQATRDALQAYADGVNAYVARNPLPPEYAALELTRYRPWTALDSISVLRLVAFSLSFELTDLDRTTLLAQYQAAGAMQGFNGAALFFEDINRLAPFNDAATIPDAQGRRDGSNFDDTSNATADDLVRANESSSSAALLEPALADPVLMQLASSYLAELRALPFVESLLKNPDDDRGSNQFIVAGSRSSTGRPILANDPHLALSAPAIWYENQISTPSFNAIGASFAGAPYIIIGHNQRLAWGLTNHLADVTDVYQERIVPDPSSPSGLSTVYNGTLEPVQALPQTFRVNTLGDGQPDSLSTVPAGGPIPAAVLVVPRRNNGPIISLNVGAGTAISVQYVGFSGTREVQAFRGFNRAKDINEFKAALQSFDVGSQNVLFADTSGNIAYFTSGEFPLREDLQAGAPAGLPPFLIRNGQGGNEWMQPPPGIDPNRAVPFAILPANEMPQLLNPPRGVIINANNDPTGNNRDNNVLNRQRAGGGILYIGSGYSFDVGVRAGRLEALFAPYLANNRKLGVSDLQRFQADVVMGDAQYYTPFIVRALANAKRPGAPAGLASLAADARVVQAVGRLAAWDQSTPTGIVEGYDASDQNGVRAQPTQLEIDNSVAATLYSVFRNQLISQTIGATLSRRSLPLPARDAQILAVKNLFDRFAVSGGVGASGLDFFEVPGVAAAADRRDIVLLRSLSNALTALASPAFADAFNGSTNQADYRWGRLHRVVLAHPAGGAFNIPPAGGAFPQPLANPNLPGIPTDGGLYTVDVGNHVLNRDQSNGFMYTAGASRRFVASIKSGGVESVSALPGGESAVPSNPFYVNLLPRWLTNESFPLRFFDAPDGDRGGDRDDRDDDDDRDGDWDRR